jgi:hypothetical protein
VHSVPWLSILTSPHVWAIIITHGASVFGYFTVVNQLPTYMKHILHFNIKAVSETAWLCPPALVPLPSFRHSPAAVSTSLPPYALLVSVTKETACGCRGGGSGILHKNFMGKYKK